MKIVLLTFLSLLMSCQLQINSDSKNSNLKISGNAVVEKGTKKWSKGQTIHFMFLDGTPEQQQEVIEISQLWTRYANLNFKFHTEDKENFIGISEMDFKISFLTPVNDSNLGRQRFSTGRMNLGSMGESFESRRRIILHEFGHMLGFEHEHQRTDEKRGTVFSKEMANKYCKLVQGWSVEKCANSIHQNITEVEYSTEFDMYSIMHYNFLLESQGEKFFFGKDYVDVYRSSLSFLDKVAVFEMYPGRVANMEQLVLMHEEDKDAEKERMHKAKRHFNCVVHRTYQKDNIDGNEIDDEGCYWKYSRKNGDQIPNESNYCNGKEDITATIVRMQKSNYCKMDNTEYADVIRKRDEGVKEYSSGICKILLPNERTKDGRSCSTGFYLIAGIDGLNIDLKKSCFSSIEKAKAYIEQEQTCQRDASEIETYRNEEFEDKSIYGACKILKAGQKSEQGFSCTYPYYGVVDLFNNNIGDLPACYNLTRAYNLMKSVSVCQ